MNSTLLLQKLIEIETSIGVETDSAIRHKVQDAQECLLRMHGEAVEHLRAQAIKGASPRFALLHEFSLRNQSEAKP